LPAGPDFISLQVRDLDTAAAFYEERVGLRRAPASPPGAVVFASEPVQLVGRGVTPVTDPFDGPFGRTFALRDPDGYTVTIHDGA
jgi:predicted enzyme related to lactoylglutathione lyase